jgi:hypothetical protein
MAYPPYQVGLTFLFYIEICFSFPTYTVMWKKEQHSVTMKKKKKTKKKITCIYLHVKIGHLMAITRNTLVSVNRLGSIIYKLSSLPTFGKLQYRSESVFSDFGSHSNIVHFTQKDIDEGSLE